MTRYVVDASVAVEYLLRTPLGVTVAGMIESSSLIAPELLDAEVLSVLRRAVLNGRLEEARARMVVEDLAHWPVDRISHRALAPLAWRYHRSVSAYDALLRGRRPRPRPAVAHSRRPALKSIRPRRRHPTRPHRLIRRLA